MVRPLPARRARGIDSPVPSRPARELEAAARRFAALPRSVSSAPPSAASDLSASPGRCSATPPRLAQPLEVFGAPVVTVTANARAAGHASWRSFARGRRPARRSSSPAAACRPARARRTTGSTCRTRRRSFRPARNSPLTLATSSLAQNPGNLLYLDLPLPSSAAACRRAARGRLPGTRSRSPDEAPLAVAAALALRLVAAAAPRAADPGVTATTVLLGGTVPLSGEAAAFGSVGPGAKAYFDYVNAKGGVNGRKIDYRFYDDGYNPAQTVQLTRQLVEQDKVFAIFNSVGTANNLAIRDYLNAQKVPQLFAGDGSERSAAHRRVPVDDGLPAQLSGRGSGATDATSSRRGRRRGSPCCSRTRTSARTCRAACRGRSRARAQIVASESYEYTATDVVLPDREAEGVRRRHADALRDAEVHDPGDRRGEEARVEAAALSRVGVDRADDHGHREGERARPDPRRARDRVRQEPERPDLGARTPPSRSTGRSSSASPPPRSRRMSTTGTA